MNYENFKKSVNSFSFSSCPRHSLPVSSREKKIDLPYIQTLESNSKKRDTLNKSGVIRALVGDHVGLIVKNELKLKFPRYIFNLIFPERGEIARCQ